MKDEDLYGFPQIGKLLQFLPLLALLQAVGSASDLAAKASAVIALLRFAAEKTDTPLDDEFLAVLEPALCTKQGADLLAWIVNKAAAMAQADAVVRAAGQVS
jgi:hypothetical protein